MSEPVIDVAIRGWERLSLAGLCQQGGGDIQTGPFGSQLHASDYRPSGVPSVMPQNIGGNVINEEGISRISRLDAVRLSKYTLLGGDIVCSRRGDVERRALVQPSQGGWLCGTGCLRVRVGSAADPRFIYYYLGHPGVRAWIRRHAVGATMPNLNTQILGALPVTLPPRSTQYAISSLLGALDDRIAVNRRIVDTSRSLATVRFASAVSESSVASRLGSVAELVTRGVTPQYIDNDDGIIVLNQRCVRGGRVSLAPSRRTAASKATRVKLLQPNDVLVNSTGVGTLGRVALWTKDIEATVDSHVSIVRFDRARVEPIIGGFAMLAAQKAIQVLGEGSTGQTELSRAKLGELVIRLPETLDRREVAEDLQVVELCGEQGLVENETLADLRDTLLPKLISGELWIKDAERQVENVV